MSLQETLQTLLIDGTASTQEALIQALTEAGYGEVSQSKMSRLLRKLGAVKDKNPDGRVVYRLLPEPSPPSLDSELSALVLELSDNEHCLVIRTSPGAASLVARLLDHKRKALSVIGTLAGDDTILVIPASVNTLMETKAALSAFLFPSN